MYVGAYDGSMCVWCMYVYMYVRMMHVIYVFNVMLYYMLCCEGSVITLFIIDGVSILESITMPIYMYVGAYNVCMCVWCMYVRMMYVYIYVCSYDACNICI